METNYLFQTDDFALSEGSLRLLRNGFNYKTIPLTDIQSMEIRKGKELKNWLWVFTIAIGLIGFAVYDTIRIFIMYFDPNINRIYIERVVIPVLPYVLGIYSLFISLRTRTILIVKSEGYNNRFSLRNIEEQKQLDSFMDFLLGDYPSLQVNITK
jgi:hypothetical protein